MREVFSIFSFLSFVRRGNVSEREKSERDL